MLTLSQPPSDQSLCPSLQCDARDRTGTLELPAEAQLLNISLSGMAVRIPRQLNVGRSCDLRLGTPVHPLEMSGLVRWCHETDRPGGSLGGASMDFTAGLEYADLTPDLTGGVLQFIYGSRILSVQRGRFSRFTIAGDEPVSLRSSHPVRVVRLDTRGLLIETETSAERGSELFCQLQLGDEEWRLPGLLARIEKISAPVSGSRYELAIEFLNTTEKDRRLLEAWIGD